MNIQHSCKTFTQQIFHVLYILPIAVDVEKYSEEKEKFQSKISCELLIFWYVTLTNANVGYSKELKKIRLIIIYPLRIVLQKL